MLFPTRLSLRLGYGKCGKIDAKDSAERGVARIWIFTRSTRIERVKIQMLIRDGPQVSHNFR